MTNDRPSQPPGNVPVDWDAIARFAAGESPADEAERVRAWLERNPADRALVERLRATTPDAIADLPNVDVEAALARVHRRMNDARRPALTVERGGGAAKPNRRRATLVFLAAAAAVVVFAVVRQRRHADDTPAQTFATNIGQRRAVLLPDSTRVVLGPASQLQIPHDFASHRTVSLRGDAYFDVRHDAAHPFAVRVGSALIEDIGTTFTIESDAGDTTSVSVMSGTVRLRPADSPPNAGAVLNAGDRGSTAGTHTLAFAQAASAEDAAWITGKLVFRDASFPRVAGELRRWYGIELRAADSAVLDRHVTTTIQGESVDEVLRIIELSLGARVDRQGDTATVHLDRPAPARVR